MVELRCLLVQCLEECWHDNVCPRVWLEATRCLLAMTAASDRYQQMAGSAPRDSNESALYCNQELLPLRLACFSILSLYIKRTSSMSSPSSAHVCIQTNKARTSQHSGRRLGLSLSVSVCLCLCLSLSLSLSASVSGGAS